MWLSGGAITRESAIHSALQELTLAQNFVYSDAFSRNIGWLTEAEQQVLRKKRIAIAGMGAVGGHHLMTLARLGIGAFNISDFDEFGQHNFNRQIGAMMSTVGKAKVDVMSGQVLDVNPEIELRSFADGIHQANIGEFLHNVDIYVDGLDFFAFDARRMVFAECAKRGIPAITVAPVGMGAALLTFMPGSMSFEDYFGWGDSSDEEKALRFALGVAPAGLHRAYLMDPKAISFIHKRVPSTAMGCVISAGVASTEVLKLALGRGKVLAAPHGRHFDAYSGRTVRTWRPGGNNHPLQRIALALGRRYLAKLDAEARAQT